MPGGGPEEAADQLLQSSMNEPVRGRAPLESPAMHSRSPKSGRADPAPGVPAQWSRRARNTGHPGCTLQSAQRSWPSPAKRRWAGLRLAGRPARAAPQNPWRPGVGGAARPRPRERGRGAGRGPRRSEPGGSVWPRRGALPRARGEARSEPRGRGQPGDPGVRTQVPSNRSRCPCRMRRRRGARRVHTHLPLRGPPLSSPRWRTRTSALQRGAHSHPRPQAGPGPCRRAARPSGTEPPRRRRAALCPCGAGWGEEEKQPPTASQAGAQAGQVLSKQVLGSGSGWVLREPSAQPWAARGSAPRLRLQTSPPLLFYTPPCYF